MISRNRMPRDLLPARMPLTILCGPPGAGKSTRATGYIIDFAEIKAKLSRLPLYAAGDKWLDAAMNERDRLLRELSSRTDIASATFITLAPEYSRRRAWREALGGDVIVLAVDPHECIRRIDLDERRRTRGYALWHALVMDWWEKFSTGPDETVIYS